MKRYLMTLVGTLTIVGAIMAPGIGTDPADCTWLIGAGVLLVIAA